MTYPNNDNQNAGLPSYSDVTGSSPNAAYANAGAYGAEGLITDKKNPLALWTLVLGIVSLVCVISVFLTGFAFIPGIVGVILGIIAMVQAKKYAPENRRTVFSVIGLIASTISIVVSVGAIIVGISMMGDCLQITDPTAQQQCVQEKMSN